MSRFTGQETGRMVSMESESESCAANRPAAVNSARVRLGYLRRFPAFIAYTVVHSARIAVLLSVYRLPTRMFIYADWIAEALDAALGILVIHEIYVNVLRNHPALRQYGRVLAQWCAAMLILVVMVTAAGSASSGRIRLATTFVVLDWSVALLKTALIVLLLSLGRFVGITGRQYAWGAAAGLAFYASVDVAGIAFRTHATWLTATAYALVKSAAFNCSVLVWMMYLLSRPGLTEAGAFLRGREMDAWNTALTELLSKNEPDVT